MSFQQPPLPRTEVSSEGGVGGDEGKQGHPEAPESAVRLWE